MPDLPLLNITEDHHVHTRYCNHAVGEMEEYVLAAIAKGLRSLTFLEHLECGLSYSPQIWLTPELFQRYFEEGEQLREKYRGQITVRLGAEIGYTPGAVDKLLAMLDAFPFAHRGLSCHFFFDGKEHLNMLSRRTDHIQKIEEFGSEPILDAYFRNLIQGCQDIPCDKLCHLDAALRHNAPVLTAHHHALIKELFAVMLEKDIALEVNTSGYELRPQPYPALPLIHQARQLGIPLIIGSDAHRPEQVGRYFERVQAELGQQA
ncbi:MAG: histidinol-phosphatase [Candidatus Electrothrix sp. GW3-4]|uniref:histidinol-phosphatase n=1 Tax=Candidatus Electrothrix sp. GW3-4 TaxID=3126740 RepID=UPI0030D136D9